MPFFSGKYTCIDCWLYTAAQKHISTTVYFAVTTVCLRKRLPLRCSTNVYLLLGQRRRRWPSSKPTLIWNFYSYGLRMDYINPCPAEYLQLYFSSFEAGIANAISRSKWQKYLWVFFKYIYSKLNYLTNLASTTNYIIYFQWHIILLKICLKPYIGRSKTRVKTRRALLIKIQFFVTYRQ